MDENTTQPPRTAQPLQLALIALALLGTLGTFLPWVELSHIGSITGTASGGWITFVLFLGTFVVAIVSVGKGRRRKALLRLGGILSTLAETVGIWKIVEIKARASGMGSSLTGEPFADSASIGAGLYIVVICGLLCAIAALTLRTKIPDDAPRDESPDPITTSSLPE